MPSGLRLPLASRANVWSLLCQQGRLLEKLTLPRTMSKAGRQRVGERFTSVGAMLRDLIETVPVSAPKPGTGAREEEAAWKSHLPSPAKRNRNSSRGQRKLTKVGSRC
jgi:hypothetical protein